MTKTQFLQLTARLGATIALLAAASGATGCLSISQRAWQNGRGLSSSDILYGDHSFRGINAYRAYLEGSARGLQVTPPNPFLPETSPMRP